MSQSAEEELQSIAEKIADLKEQYRETQKKIPGFLMEPVFFQSSQGKVSLAELFDDYQELILVYNMGSDCPYCSLWADEYNGIYRHLRTRAAFVVSSPESPETQSEVKKKRGWKFSMVQSSEKFRKQMGFEDEDGNFWPGFSVFEKKKDGSIHHVRKEFFGPGDFYCTAWNYLENLPSFENDWHPEFPEDS